MEQFHDYELPPLKERVIKPIQAAFYKLGGTWDMVERNGRLLGTGNLDDDAIYGIEESFGLHTNLSNKEQIKKAEKKLALTLYQRMRTTKKEPDDMSKHFAPWAKVEETDEEFGYYSQGSFFALYSGDSSHLRSSFSAPIIKVLLERVTQSPNKPLLGAQGTDTADVALLTTIDALVFDTKLPPFMITGANRSHREEKSDAPQNFVDLAKLTHLDIRLLNPSSDVGDYDDENIAHSGVFWIFGSHIYTAASFAKIDPTETRIIEGQTTFFAPHRSIGKIDNVLRSAQLWHASDWDTCEPPPPGHITNRISLESLYDAMNQVTTVDLGEQNKIWEQIQQILNLDDKATILEAHSLGNVSNPIRKACVEAAKQGKIIIAVSRALIGEVNQRYAGSLLDANETEGELKGTGSMIISAHKLNPTAARAIAIRAILEGFDQERTQKLMDKYCQDRGLMN